MDALPKRYKPAEIEAKWRARWQETGVYRWDPSRGRDETFVVDSPPPTVSGALHVGHVFSYTHQDLIVRHRRMTGMNIFYPMGWDDNGLPTERRVQNMFNVRCDPHQPYVPGFSPKKEKKSRAELVSRQNFIELCHEVTQADERAFRELWLHLGLSIDWELEYATIDEHCRKTSQLSFLKLLEDGHAVSLEAPTLWDIDFQTAVAQAEVADRNLQGAFHDIRFGVEGGDSFVIATTRPELLAACVAVVAHPDDERYQHLFGKRAITPLYHVPVVILPDDRADPEKGTGILMVCTFGDTTDVEWWRQYALPLRQIVGRNGRLLPACFGKPGWESLDPDDANAHYREISDRSLKQARAAVVEQLRLESGAALPGLGAPLVSEPRPIEHAVKMFEKGDRPLEIITTRQWFVRLLDKKTQLLEQGKKIEWHPQFMRARYDSWVEGLNQEWCVSRQRYFGVPFPCWYSLDNKGKPNYDEPILPSEDALPVDPLAQPAPGYDESARGKPGGFAGDPDVMDTWATSSLTPQIVSHWATNKTRHEKLFPMDMRPQSHEIIRTWAFYTIAKAYLHENDVPWKHVVISGWILDPDRKKMSKSRGNVVTPDHILNQYSSDAVRYWAARARLGVDTTYDESVFRNGKRLSTKLFNAAKFVVGHLMKEELGELNLDAIVVPLDQAFLSKLGKVVETASNAFVAFDYASALQAVEDFFWTDLCDNYLELIKSRVYQEELTDGRRSVLATLEVALSVQLRLFAPFVPYLAEEVWSWIFASNEGRDRSIHTSRWPTVEEVSAPHFRPGSDVFNAALEVVREVRRVKGEAQVSMKTPLRALEVTGSRQDIEILASVLDDLLAVNGATSISLHEGTVEEGRFFVKVELK